MTVAAFKAERPEFTNTDTAVVQTALDKAATMCPAEVWGARVNEGVSAYAAQWLALSPAGRGMELVSDGMTVYDQELNTLRSIVAGGPMVAR